MARQRSMAKSKTRAARADAADTRQAVEARIDTITRAGILAILVATIVLVCVVRFRLADVPLERDEGEYAYAGQLILQGIPPYEQAYNMKFPGAYYAYAGIMAVFGQSAWGIRVGLLVVHLATMLLVFRLGQRLAGTLAGGLGASVFALLALDPWSMGIFAHATHFVTLPIVAALLLMHDATRAWRFLAAGLLLGAAIVMKQQAIFLAALALPIAMRTAGPLTFGRPHPDALRRLGLVLAGIAAAFALLVGVLAVAGVLGRFWFWTFQYASQYVSQIPVSLATTTLPMAWDYITQATGLWWYVGVTGLGALFIARWAPVTRFTLACWFIGAALAVAPGLYFRPHYFIVLMPVVGLLGGIAVASADRAIARALSPMTARVIVLVGFAVLAGSHVYRQSHFFFRMTPTEVLRSVYQANPFPESPEVARYLAAHTAPDDRIAVLGSEPQIAFYANRKSASGHIYMYPLTEPQPFAARMTEEFKREIEAARPAYVVFVDAGSSWVATLKPDTRIVDWSRAFTASCYTRVGVADIPPTGAGIIRWDADAIGYEPTSTSRIFVYRRLTDSGCGDAAR
jgi:hypothetical protein